MSYSRVVSVAKDQNTDAIITLQPVAKKSYALEEINFSYGQLMEGTWQLVGNIKVTFNNELTFSLDVSGAGIYKIDAFLKSPINSNAIITLKACPGFMAKLNLGYTINQEQ